MASLERQGPHLSIVEIDAKLETAHLAKTFSLRTFTLEVTGVLDLQFCGENRVLRCNRVHTCHGEKLREINPMSPCQIDQLY